MTRADRNRRAGHADKTPNLWVSPDMMPLVSLFWELRGLCEDRDKPIMPGVMLDYERASGKLLHPWQRSIIFAVDAMFRVTLSEEIAANETRRMEAEKRKGRRK